MMELSPRLQAVADWIPHGTRMADIGTDHGHLPIWLLKQGIIKSAIAADLRVGPLEAAKRAAIRFGVTERISFRLCNGLAGIGSEEVDTVVIAGMGGKTIAGIIADAPWILDGETSLLVQPQSAFPELRAFLWESGYQICREQISREGNRFYTIMEIRGGTMPPLSTGELWVGRQSNDPLRGVYLDWMSGVLAKMLAGQAQAAQGFSVESVSILEALTEVFEMKKEWESWQ